jgi:hypothetical protein
MMTTVHGSLGARETTFSVVIGLCFPVDRNLHDDDRVDSDGTNCAASWAHDEEDGKVVKSR